MYQLLERPNVKMLKFGQKEARMWHAASFTREHEGLEPRHYPEFLSIVGDKTDEIPGIKGIGAVGAYKILAQLPEPTLESLYENMADLQVTPHVRNLLEQGRDDAFMFREIIVLKEDLELEPLHKPKLNRRRLEKLMAKMKFRSLLENSDEMDVICALGS
jgi:DNA polymerase-1